MNALIIVVAAIAACSALSIAAGNFLKQKDEEMERAIRRDKKRKELLAEAAARYPERSQIDAVSQRINDIEMQIIELKKSALNTDVLYIINNLTQDKDLLISERAYLCALENEQSEYSILRTAQI